MAKTSPSNRLCLQPNFPWHTLNSECKTASLQVCVCLWVCMFEQVSVHVTARTKCTGLTGSWQHGRSFLKPITTKTHTPSLYYWLYNRQQSFYSTTRGHKVSIKTRLLSETTGQRHPVCYNSSSATPRVAHFLAVSVITRNLHCPLTCWFKWSLLLLEANQYVHLWRNVTK